MFWEHCSARSRSADRWPRPWSALFVFAGLTSLAAAACNDHPVRAVESEGAVEHQIEYPVSETEEIDLLWVVDNSRSMCQEQAALRRQFPKFVRALRRHPVDFHVAVTTTDVSTKSSCSPAGNQQVGNRRFDGGPGCLQSRPRPTVNYGKSCLYRREEGVYHDGRDGRPGPDFAPVRRQLDQARRCTKHPSDWQHLKASAVDRSLIECALSQESDAAACAAAPRPTPHIACELDGDPAACNASSRPSDGTLQPRDLFPPQSAYAAVGNDHVLRAEAYRKPDDTLRMEKLRRDFACMSFVGTRGSGIEQGLRALVRAVSPERTGGPADVENPRNPDAPNHGFLRKEARFGAIFVSDENDCTNSAGLASSRQQCGGPRCYFGNRVGPDEKPLVPLQELYESFRTNLAESKGVDRVPSDEIFMGVVHGGYLPFQHATEAPESCSVWRNRHPKTSPMEMIPRTCRSTLGAARSGDRYEEFLTKFENFFPERQPVRGVPGDHIPGQLCRGDLGPVFEEMGRFFRPPRPGCIQRSLPTCDGTDDCPTRPYEVGTPVCADHPSRDSTFCRTGVEISLFAPDDVAGPRKRLRSTNFCAAGGVETTGEGASCVVDPALYRWTSCPGDGLTFEWKRPMATGGRTRQVRRRLSDLHVRVRYLSTSKRN